MQPAIDTAIQWLQDTIRVQARAQKEWNPPPPPGEWVALCWEVGHSLVMMQAHGIPIQPVIEAVSARLVEEFGEHEDLSAAGIRTMRQFFLDYFERPQLLPKLRGVTWECHKYLMAHSRDPLQQEFYLELCRRDQLTSPELAEAMRKRRYELSAASPKAATVSRTGRKS